MKNTGTSSVFMSVARILVGLMFIMFASAYAVAVAELLIGVSMVLGFWVRPFSIVGALFMFNLILATWNLPPGTAAWRYVGNQLETIPLLLLFLIFFAHSAGETLGLDKRK